MVVDSLFMEARIAILLPDLGAMYVEGLFLVWIRFRHGRAASSGQPIDAEGPFPRLIIRWGGLRGGL